MPEITGIEKLFSLTVRKMWSRFREFGTSQLAFTRFGDEDVYLGKAIFADAFLGDTKFGDYILLSGIYRSDNVTGITRFYRQPYRIVRNPRTARQQAWRRVFADAVAAWRLLTPEEQHQYNILGKQRNNAGRNIFLSRYLKSK